MNEISIVKITRRVAHDGYVTWGFVLSDGTKQAPSWHRRCDALGAARFHKVLREGGSPEQARRAADGPQ